MTIKRQNKEIRKDTRDISNKKVSSKTDNINKTSKDRPSSSAQVVELNCVCGKTYKILMNTNDSNSHKIMVCSNCTPLNTKQERIINTNRLIEKISKIKKNIK